LIFKSFINQKIIASLALRNNFFSSKNDFLQRRFELKSKIKYLKITMIRIYQFELQGIFLVKITNTQSTIDCAIDFRMNFQFLASNLIETYWFVN